MRKLVLAAIIGASLTSVIATPALAQNYDAQRRWDAAQSRYQRETDIYNRERDLYYSRGGYRGDRGGPPPGGYGYASPPSGGYGYAAPAATDYDAARYYRDGPNYQERQMSYNDQAYRGSDGRYYCKRSDGTTGLIVGGAGGAVLGNVVDGGHNRVAGTLIGGALGAIIGKSVEQSNDQYRCR